MAESIIPFRSDLTPRIPETGLRGREGEYHADPALVNAANVALALDLPLLLTGEPGCGKTDFAFVAANALADLAFGEDAPSKEREVLECHVRSDSRARDLLYHYDALLRFTEGHHGGDAGRARAEDARHYIELQPLGVALTSPVRRVLLIDEIDKAPRDLPNDLLRELDRHEFEIPEIPDAAADRDPVRDRTTGAVLLRTMKHSDQDKPFIVITSNVERQLPDAFLRRCVFYHIEFPDSARLRSIVRSRLEKLKNDTRFAARVKELEADTPFVDRVVRIFEKARAPKSIKPPSTAELLHWIEAMTCFPARDMRAAIEAFDRAVGDDGMVKGGRRWTELPAAGCLFKLREDGEAAHKRYAAPQASR